MIQVVRLPPSDKWAHALLDRIFDGTLWPTDQGYRVVDRDDTRLGEPAVVVVPGEEWQHQVPQLNAYLARFPRVVLALVADEGALFPWRQVQHPNLRLWIQTPRPRVHTAGAAVYFGFGWAYDTPDLLRDTGRAYERRDWFFAGQITHRRRRELVDVLRTMPNGLLEETAAFAEGIPREQYLYQCARARWVPCPTGPVCVDSFRLYEALEAGCVPYVDSQCPGYPESAPNTPISAAEYWPLVYGPDHPLHVIDDWADLRTVDLAPEEGPRMSAWWQQHKRGLAWRMRDDALGVEPGATVDGITVVVTSSPIPSHPSLEVLEATLVSIRERLPDVEVLICADGWTPDSGVTRGAYADYLARLAWNCEHLWERCVPIIGADWQHQAGMTRRALDHVRTSCVLLVEHDTPLWGDPDVPWQAMVGAIHAGAANVIRLASEAFILPSWRHLYPDAHPTQVEGIPLLRTTQWSSRPHLADTAWYQRMLDVYFGPDARTFTEDVLHGVLQTVWRVRGVQGWREWRVWLYAPPGDMKRSGHIDGRNGATKAPMVWAYPDGVRPFGAPKPTVVG